MRSLIYLQPMSYPGEKTHTIQITRTVAALGEHVDVLLVVGSLTVEPEYLKDAVRRIYGVELGPRVRAIEVRRWWLVEPLFPFALRKILSAAGGRADYYTRSFPIARRLLRYQWWHGGRVFLETHKKAGYLKEDPVPDSRYLRIRNRFERTNDPRWRIRRIYSRVDCLFFLHRHSLEAVARDQAVRGAEHLWYGLQPPASEPAHGRHGFVYCGSVVEHKLFDLLLDALDRVKMEVRVSVYGAEPSRVAKLKKTTAGRPCWARLVFHDRRDHADLQGLLRAYQYGVALQEGLKVVDYLENGLTPIVPDLPSYREVLDERHALFFRADDPDSLARRLDGVDQRTADPAAVRELLDTFSVERRAQKILARLR